MRISDWSSDVCSSDLEEEGGGFPVSFAHKVSSGEDGYARDCPVHRATANDDLILARANVVGGTAFFFARDENVQGFDWLFVDEAGQVGLANMVAMGRAARNIVLVRSEERRVGKECVSTCR